jgi:hypothetical protein
MEAFLASEGGLALKAALVVAFADFATGSFAALRDGTFALDALAAFLRTHILGRVAPLGTLLRSVRCWHSATSVVLSPVASSRWALSLALLRMRLRLHPRSGATSDRPRNRMSRPIRLLPNSIPSRLSEPSLRRTPLPVPGCLPR